MSQQERVSWVSLMVNGVIGCWYFTQVLALPADTDLLGPGMAVFIIVLIVGAILTAIVSEAILREIQRRSGEDVLRIERPDERDHLIGLRAGRNAYVALVIGTGAILSLVGITQWMGSWGLHPSFSRDTVLARMLIGPETAQLVAQWLLLALTLAEICKYLTRIVSYRRGY